MSQANFVRSPEFNDYKERFKEHFTLTRREDGVLLAQAHTNGGPVKLSVEGHKAFGQMFHTIGADPKNELLIFSGTGDDFMMEVDPEGFRLEEQDLAHWAYERAYKDGRTNVSALINDIEIPTIGIMNGPGFHSEMCLMCDITICSEDPGDGIHSYFIELLGVKRAAYALLTGQAIDAKAALEYGLVNEVVPKNQLVERASKIANHIMSQPRITRRLTTQAKGKAIHTDEHISSGVGYVRRGNRNSID
jgi:enoyl-CoA hydratase/carnithine racemase